jgi:hypothetical protein
METLVKSALRRTGRRTAHPKVHVARRAAPVGIKHTRRQAERCTAPDGAPRGMWLGHPDPAGERIEPDRLLGGP